MLMSPKEVDAVGDMQSSRVMLQSINLSPQSHSGVEVLGVLGDGSRSNGSRSDGSRFTVLLGPLWGDPPDANMSLVDIFLRITLEHRWERERERKKESNFRKPWNNYLTRLQNI